LSWALFHRCVLNFLERMCMEEAWIVPLNTVSLFFKYFVFDKFIFQLILTSARLWWTRFIGRKNLREYGCESLRRKRRLLKLTGDCLDKN
jgi:hypothetical protein